MMSIQRPARTWNPVARADCVFELVLGCGDDDIGEASVIVDVKAFFHLPAEERNHSHARHAMDDLVG